MLSREYSNFPLLDFLSCAPSEAVPRSIYDFLKCAPPPAVNGRACVAPCAIRKLETALLAKHEAEEAVVPHENYIEEFVKDDTKVIGSAPWGFLFADVNLG